MNYFLMFSLAIVLTGCLLPGKEKELRDDIFDLQARLARLEQSTEAEGQNTNANDKKNKKNLAAFQADLEKTKREIQKLRGEIDALRVGVKTGQIPGEDPEDGSVAQTLGSIVTRLEALEASQDEMLALVAKKPKKAKKLSSLKALRSAYKARRYTHVSENAAKVFKRQKSKSAKEEVLFLHSESLYKLGNMREAALKYNEFIDNFAGSARLPQAKMRMGDCFRHLGDKATAKLYYEDLISSFPKSQQAAKAKEKLDGLEKKGAAKSKKKGTRTARKAGSKKKRGM